MLPPEPLEGNLHHTKDKDWVDASLFYSEYPPSAKFISKVVVCTDVVALDDFNYGLECLIKSVGSLVEEIGTVKGKRFSEYVPAEISKDQLEDLTDVVNNWMLNNNLIPTICEISDVKELTENQTHRGD